MSELRSRIVKLSEHYHTEAYDHKMDVYNELKLEPTAANDDFCDFMFFAGVQARKNQIVAEIFKENKELDSPETIFFEALADRSNDVYLKAHWGTKNIIGIGRRFFNRGVDFENDFFHDAIVNLTGGTGGKIL